MANTRETAKLAAAAKKEALKKQKKCIILFVLDDPFNQEIESRKKQIKSYILFPIESLNGIDNEEVNI